MSNKKRKSENCEKNGKNEKNVGLKDSVKCFKLSAKLCPQFVASAFIKQFFADIIPFISIIFSYFIINALVEKAQLGYVFTLIGAMLALNLVCYTAMRVARHFLEKYESVLEYKIDAAVSKKSFYSDYAQTEDPAVLKMLQAALEGANSNGGIANLILCGAHVFGAVLKIAYSLGLIISVFVSGTGAGEGSLYNFAASPLGGAAIIALLCGSVAVSVLVSRADARAAVEVMEGNIENNRKFSYIFSVCTNYVFGKDIRIYGMNNLLMPKVRGAQADVNELWNKYSNLNIKFQCATTVASYLLLFAAYAYVGLRAYYNIISIGAVAAGVSAVTSVSSSVSTFLELLTAVKRNASYLKYYSDYLALPSAIGYGKLESVPDFMNIEFKNVSFKYPGQSVYALKNVSFKINSGEKIAFVGKNGAGKTTLIKLLLRFYPLTEGEILINGVNIEQFSRSALYDLFAAVFQDFKLFSYALKENVDCGELDENGKTSAENIEKRVVECLTGAGVYGRFKNEQKGINSVLYQNNREDGIEISGGEAQKIAIARALYKNAPAVILDEPTSALDPIAEAEVYEKFNYLIGGKTSIFVSHRMSSCRFCDRIVVFDGGSIAQLGTHDQLLKEGGAYSEMWNAQAKYYA